MKLAAKVTQRADWRSRDLNPPRGFKTLLFFITGLYGSCSVLLSVQPLEMAEMGVIYPPQT